MARTNLAGVEVDTAAMLHRVQQALTRAEATGDAKLKQDAENVLSALTVVLRHRRAVLPAALRASIDVLLDKAGCW